MFSSFVIVWVLTIESTVARSESASSKGVCDFGNSDVYHDVKDLLRCMNDLASANVFTGEEEEEEESVGGSMDERGWSSEPYTPGESSSSPLSSFIASLFNGGSTTVTAAAPQTIPLDPSSNYYQTNYPVAQGVAAAAAAASAGAFNVNLLDALHSISRYDDLKCVPRILCEVASGVTPVGSIRTRAFDTIANFGESKLVGLLSNLEFVGSSPLLSFANAALLGYASRRVNGDNCYKAYPRCPKNSQELIHYLNNHNGGFFRFFHKGDGANRPYRPSYYRAVRRKMKRPDESVFIAAKERTTGYAKGESDRTGTGELKFDTPILLEERIQNKGTRWLFPNEAKGNEKLLLMRLPKISNELQSYVSIKSSLNYTSFFPQETSEEPSAFTSHSSSFGNQLNHFPSLSSQNEFTFPDD